MGAMVAMTALIVLAAVGVGSLAFRVGPLLLLQTRSLPEVADRAIRHAGLAALAALISTSARHSAHGPSVGPTLIAISVALILAARRASMVWICLVGAGLYAVASTAIGFLAR